MAGELVLNYTGTNDTYVRIHKQSTGEVWDVTNDTWATWVDGDIDDYDTPLVDQGGGVFTADFPGSIEDDVKVRLVYCRQEGSSPDLADRVLNAYTRTWTGSSLGEDDLGAGVIDEAWVSLTTVQALPGMDEFTDAQVRIMLNGVTDAIERYCKRHFKQADYALWMNDKGHSRLWVPNRPISEVKMISDGIVEVISLRHEDDDASWAFTRATDSVVVITSETGSVETSTSFTYADYASITALVAAMDAVANWDVDLLSANYGIKNPSNIRPIEASYCRDQYVYLSAPYWYVNDYQVEYDKGCIVWNSAKFPKGVNNIYISYTGGYADGEVPPELTTAVLQLCRMVAGSIEDDPTLKSFRLGDYAWTKAVSLLADEHISTKYSRLLDAFRVPTI